MSRLKQKGTGSDLTGDWRQIRCGEAAPVIKIQKIQLFRSGGVKRTQKAFVQFLATAWLILKTGSIVDHTLSLIRDVLEVF